MLTWSRTAVVKARIAPLYVKADEGAELADEVLHGMVVEVADAVCDRAFVRVRTHYRYEGFARQCDLVFDNRLVQMWQEAEKSTIFHAAVDVLNAPEVQASKVCLLTRGCEIVRLQDEEDGWTRVRAADGSEGFLRTGHTGHHVQMLADNAWKTFSPREEQAFRQSLVEAALAYKQSGAQYRWGGKTPEGIDCSGLCSMAYMLNGVLICRDARMEEGFPVKQSAQLSEPYKAGDLLYFPGHIAMSLGGSRFIHATAVGNGVCINSLDKTEADCRADLADSLLAVGSVF